MFIDTITTMIINIPIVEYMNTEFDLISLRLLFDWSFDIDDVLSMKSTRNDLWFVLSGFWERYGVCIVKKDWWGICSGGRDWWGFGSGKRVWEGSGSPNDWYGVRLGVLISVIPRIGYGESKSVCSIVLGDVDSGSNCYVTKDSASSAGKSREIICWVLQISWFQMKTINKI